MSLVAAGVAGQIFTASPGTAFITKTGRNFLQSDTLAHTWVKGSITQNSSGDGTGVSLSLGFGFFPKQTDAADFPDLSAHDGDWQLHDIRSLIETSTATGSGKAPLLPTELATVDIESAGQRSVPTAGDVYSLFCMAQVSALPSSTIDYHVSFTQLWLIAR